MGRNSVGVDFDDRETSGISFDNCDIEVVEYISQTGGADQLRCADRLQFSNGSIEHCKVGVTVEPRRVDDTVHLADVDG